MNLIEVFYSCAEGLFTALTRQSDYMRLQKAQLQKKPKIHKMGHWPKHLKAVRLS